MASYQVIFVGSFRPFVGTATDKVLIVKLVILRGSNCEALQNMRGGMLRYRAVNLASSADSIGLLTPTMSYIPTGGGSPERKLTILGRPSGFNVLFICPTERSAADRLLFLYYGDFGNSIQWEI